MSDCSGYALSFAIDLPALALYFFRHMIFILSLLAAVTVSAEPSREGMRGGRWSTGVKDFFGTSYEAYDSQGRYSDDSATSPISRVWFTGARGILTEVYWPTIDTAQVHDSQFLVSDGSSFLFEERKNAQVETRWEAPGVPIFHILNRDPAQRFEIEKTILADPSRDVVFQRITFRRLVPGLKLFLLHSPAVGNTPLGDHCKVDGQALLAWQENQAQALVSSLPFKAASAGFSGASSDGYQDLSQDFRLDSQETVALDGNVVLTAQMDLPEDVGISTFDLALGFGTSTHEARSQARYTLETPLSDLLQTEKLQWQSYQASLRDLSAAALDGGTLFRASLAILKSSEDKSYPGAFVASPSIPWGEHSEDWTAIPPSERAFNNMTGGYHLVWPRDLFQIATAFLAVGDSASARASLNFLRSIQLREGEYRFGFRHHSRDGSFPQNAWANGSPFWQGLQMDEVAMPILLAERLRELDAISPAEYWDMLRRAADFIQEFGPWSPQERWEEQFGASPSTIAVEIAALRIASDWASVMGDRERSRRYERTARDWSEKEGDNLSTWMFTESGPHGDGRYFVRVEGAASFDQVWDPNDTTSFFLANGGGLWSEKSVTDAGFLELVRFGIRDALSWDIVESLPEIDQTIRVEIPGVGPGFHRYLGDRYNTDDLTGVQTAGMLWPLLTGERGHYELQAALEKSLNAREAGRPYLRTLELMATASQMLPEQVWKSGPGIGKPTGSATPLAWSHAEYVKLLRSVSDGRVFDRPL